MPIYHRYRDVLTNLQYSKVIRREEDFPTPSDDNKIYLENKVYVIDANVSHSHTLVFPSSGGCVLTAPLQGNITRLTYTGSGNQFEGTLNSSSIIELSHFECDAGIGNFCYITTSEDPGTYGGILGLVECGVYGGESGGTIIGASVAIRTSQMQGLKQGFNIVGTGLQLVSIIDTSFQEWGNEANTIYFSLSGVTSVFEVVNCRFNNQSNEYVFYFHPSSLTLLTPGKVTGSFFLNDDNIFYSDSQTNFSTNFWFKDNESIASVINSHTFGVLLMNGNTTYTTINYSGDDGDISGFAASVSNPTTHTTVTCTSSHGLANGREVVIIGNTPGNCSSYCGTYIISNVTSTTFDIEKVYTETGTAKWESGWEKISGDTFTNDFNERFDLVSNTLVSDNRLPIDSGSIDLTISLSISIAATKTAQVGVFYNGKRLSKSQLSIGLNQSTTSSNPPVNIVQNDVYEVRIRNMTDTTNILASNGQLIVKE